MHVIGDVHNKIDKYNRIVKDLDCSVQVGDMGWNYHKIDADASKHKFFGGNHDNYNMYYQSPHSLGDYGYENIGGVDFFFIRGAFSIDHLYQKAHGCWFKQEELTYSESFKCIDDYCSVKPDIVLTHTCPSSVAKMIGSDYMLRSFGFDPATFRTSTGQLLQALWSYHRPSLWVFGHFHKSWCKKINGTEFVCLKELERFEING